MKIDGLYLRNEIARRELTISDFARKAGLSDGAVRKALNNSRATTRTLGKLAHALDVENPTSLLKSRLDAAE